MLAIGIFDKISVANTVAVGEAQSSSGWISIGSELSSLSFKSSVRAIHYSKIVIKSLCSNLDIRLYYTTAYFRLQNSVRAFSVADCN